MCDENFLTVKIQVFPFNPFCFRWPESSKDAKTVISAYYHQQHLQRFNLWCEQCEATCDVKEPDLKELADEVIRLKFVNEPDEKKRAKKYNLARKNDQRKHYVIDDPQLIKDAESNEWMPDFDLKDEQAAIDFINNHGAIVV